MSCSNHSGGIYCLLTGLGKIIQPFLLLAIRLYFGFLLLQIGLAKVTNLSQTVESFHSINIPFPTVSAYLVTFVEVVGAFLLIIGFGSRLAALAIAIVMLTAIFLTSSDVFLNFFSDPSALAKTAPFNYLLAALTILAFGPGLFSIDAIIKGLKCRSHGECKVENKGDTQTPSSHP